jgi:ATP-dependent DNA helicase PIF1
MLRYEEACTIGTCQGTGRLSSTSRDLLGVCTNLTRKNKMCGKIAKYKFIKKDGIVQTACGHHSRYYGLIDDSKVVQLAHSALEYDNDRCSRSGCVYKARCALTRSGIRQRGSTCHRHVPRESLSNDQQEFLKSVLNGDNTWLRGKAGTGKSHVLRHAIDILRFRKKNVVVAGPTGISASNINGHTLHTVIGDIGFGRMVDDAPIYDYDIIVIDEISMVGASLWKKTMDIINNEAFNIQIIVCGDFKQLPPVKDNWCHYTEEWTNCKFIEHVLTTRHRSADEKLNNLIDFARDFEGSVKEFKKCNILKPFTRDIKNVQTTLFYTNEEVKNNLVIPKESIELKAVHNGTDKEISGFKNWRLPKVVQIAVGSRVMNIRNDRTKGIYNGMIGRIESIGDGSINVDFNGHKVEINRVNESYKLEYYNGILCNSRKCYKIVTRRQYPLVPAECLTIHKSQGLTLPHLKVDLTKAKDMRLVYVALSRAVSSEQLQVVLKKTQSNQQTLDKWIR